MCKAWDDHKKRGIEEGIEKLYPKWVSILLRFAFQPFLKTVNLNIYNLFENKINRMHISLVVFATPHSFYTGYSNSNSKRDICFGH